MYDYIVVLTPAKFGNCTRHLFRCASEPHPYWYGLSKEQTLATYLRFGEPKLQEASLTVTRSHVEGVDDVIANVLVATRVHTRSRDSRATRLREW